MISSSAYVMICLVALIACFATVEAYSVRSIANRASRSLQMSTKKNSNQDERVFRVEIPLGEGYQSVITNFRPIFAKSTIFVTTYDIPFSLNVEKAPAGFPAPIVKKAGKGGEIQGDLLRATTCWSQGFSAAGVTSDIAMFAGNIKYRKSIYDTTGAPWDEIVNALLSNTEERSKTVTLVFERELPDDDEDEEEEVAPPATA